MTNVSKHYRNLNQEISVKKAEQIEIQSLVDNYATDSAQET